MVYLESTSLAKSLVVLYI